MPLVPQKDKINCKNIGGMIINLVAEFQAEYDKLYKENAAYRATGLTPEEISTLKAENERLKSSLRFTAGACYHCKYSGKDGNSNDESKKCRNCYSDVNSNWEWRGLEDSHEQN